ncbi:MAG: hypothetical protein M3Z02_08140 [Actinomycetota bacterium]|nr:hypothetical protein [Actinomycetota bacterium]
MTGTAAPRPSKLPVVVFAAAFAAVVVGDGLRIVHEVTSSAPAFGAWLESSVGALSFAAVGALVARNRPTNAVGWLLLAVGAASALQLVTGEYAMYAHYVEHDRLVGAAAAGWVSAVAVVLLIAALPAAFLLFPDGRSVSARWRPLSWLCGLVAASFAASTGLSRGQLDNTPGISNPVGILPEGVGRAMSALAAVGLLVSVLAAMASLAVRWRRSGPDGREQLKWVLFATVVGPGAIILASALLSSVASGRNGSVLWAIGIGVIPAAAGVSILRYRLYDIDRIVSRTVSYAIVTGLLVAVYVGSVTVASRLTPSGNSLAVAAATLAVAALFQPLRRRVQAGVDHRFNRSRYDAARTIDAFSARLREQVDLEALQGDLLTVVRRTMQPSSAGLWLRSAP